MVLSKFKINFHSQNIKYHCPKMSSIHIFFKLGALQSFGEHLFNLQKMFLVLQLDFVFTDKVRCLMFFHSNKKANSSITCPDVIPVRIVRGKFFPFGCFNQVHPFRNLQLATPGDSNQQIMRKQREKLHVTNVDFNCFNSLETIKMIHKCRKFCFRNIRVCMEEKVNRIWCVTVNHKMKSMLKCFSNF